MNQHEIMDILANQNINVSFINDGKNKYYEIDNEKVDFSEIEEKFSYEIHEGIKTKLKEKLIALCDHKQHQSMIDILGYKSTKSQIERYQRKYERAKAGIYSDQENRLIIQSHEQFLDKKDAQMDLIEAIRITINRVINTDDYDKAEKMLAIAHTIKTDSDLDNFTATFR